MDDMERPHMKKPTGTAKQPTSVKDWLDSELARDPKFRREVEETLMGMRIEQDLASLRELRGVTQAQLAHMLGISQSVIGRLESGKAQNIGIRTLVRIATALGGQVHLSIKADPRPRRPIVLQGGDRGTVRGSIPGERKVRFG
jgi:DNA-binding Xre family transcriptional regulator